MKRPQLYHDWRDAWRWYTVRVLTAMGALPSIWVGIPPDIRNVVPTWVLCVLAAVMGLAGIFGAVINQDAADTDGSA